MDIISHGLYGWAVFGNKNKKQFRLATAFGVLPDLLVFGVPFIVTIGTAIFTGNRTTFWPWAHHSDTGYEYSFYNVTHSIIIRAIVFSTLRLIYKKPVKATYARLLHILVDIPTHSLAFFATPFLWPLSNYKFDGIPRSNKMIFLPNVAILIILYTIYFRRKYKKKEKKL